MTIPWTLRNLNIWDGRAFLNADSLTVQDRHIVSVGDAAGTPNTIDCGGATAIPGLVDGHVHLELDPDDHQPPEAIPHDASERRELLERMALRAAAMVGAGITTARDLGGGTGLELELRDRINAGELPGPRLLCAGQPVTSPRGHCHFWGGEAASLAEGLAVIERQVDRGVDLIKIMATGGRLTRGSNPVDAQFDIPTLRGLVGRATAHGLDVAAHCHGTRGIDHAVAAGVRTIEHCSWVGPEGWASDYQAEVAERIAAAGIWVSPTVNRGWQRMLDSARAAVLSRVRASFAEMRALEIPLIASTDAGIPGVYHHHLPEALRVFAAIAQLGNEQVLVAATSDAARALKLDHDTGRLAPGYRADILLLDGDPLTDLQALTRPVGIWANGRVIRPVA